MDTIGLGILGVRRVRIAAESARPRTATEADLRRWPLENLAGQQPPTVCTQQACA